MDPKYSMNQIGYFLLWHWIIIFTGWNEGGTLGGLFSNVYRHRSCYIDIYQKRHERWWRQGGLETWIRRQTNWLFQVSIGPRITQYLESLKSLDWKPLRHIMWTSHIHKSDAYGLALLMLSLDGLSKLALNWYMLLFSWVIRALNHFIIVYTLLGMQIC